MRGTGSDHPPEHLVPPQEPVRQSIAPSTNLPQIMCSTVAVAQAPGSSRISAWKARPLRSSSRFCAATSATTSQCSRFWVVG